MTELRFSVTAKLGAFELQVAHGSEESPVRRKRLAIVGPNGAGKSTLLGALLGTVRARGVVHVGDATLLDSGRGIDVPVEARRLGFVPQSYGLFPHLSVRENIAFAARSSEPRLSPSELTAHTESALAHLGLSHLEARMPRTLSGGERQRVALARALAVRPRALLFDEPLAALDVTARRSVRRFLARTLAELALPSVIVTHDALDARALADVILVIEAGRVTQTGTFEELEQKPASGFVRDFVESVDARLDATHGETPGPHEAESG